MRNMPFSDDDRCCSRHKVMPDPVPVTNTVPAPNTVHVIAASGRSGLALCRSLLASGIRLIPVVRNTAKWDASGLPGAPRLADLHAPEALRAALADATHIVSCAHARHTAAIIAAAPEAAQLVLLGSTRKFTRWPDAHGNGVLAGEAALLGIRTLRRHAAPDDDLRCPGRGQRSATGQPAAAAAGYAVCRAAGGSLCNRSTNPT